MSSKLVYISIVSALFVHAAAYSAVNKLKVTVSSCPCSDPIYCNRITAPPRREVVGFADKVDYYKQYDWSKLTTIIVTEPVIDQVGMEIVCYAHQHDTRVLIATSVSRDELRNATARSENIQYYFNITQKYYMDGANVDVEILTPQCDVRKGLTDYVNETSQVHKAANKHALPWPPVDVSGLSPAKYLKPLEGKRDLRCYLSATGEVVTDVPWLPDLYQGHNTWALAKYSDFLFIMSYDEISTVPPCFAAANAPLYRTEIGAKLFKDIGISGDKLVIALPWYGYIFNCSKHYDGKYCMTEPDGFNCKRVSLSYGQARQMLPESVHGQQWSEWFASPYMNMKIPGGYEQIWYDDAKSSKLKYDIADKYEFRGVGMFTLDSLNYANASDPSTKDMWDAVPQYN